MTLSRSLIVTLPIIFGGQALAAATDWAITIQGAQPICAKSQDTCEAAIGAIHRGWWGDDLRGLPLECKPHPGCFSDESGCIEGYNCR